MREPTKLWVWKVVAVGALGGCAYLALRPVDSGLASVASAACARPGAASFFLGMNADDAEELRSPELEQLIAAVESAPGIPARCLAINRLSFSAELDARGVALIVSYTTPAHSPDLRVCATNALGEVHDGSALEALVALVDDPMLVDTALRALAVRDDPAARGALATLATTGPQQRRVQAVVALASTGAPEALALVNDLLAHASQNQRYMLIGALGSSHDPKALPILEELLARSTRNDQMNVIAALGEFGGPLAARSLLAAMRERPALAQAITQALARTGDPSARAELVAMAERSDNPVLADSALAALAQVDGDEVRALMQRALQGGSFQRLNAAMEYFAGHPDERAVGLLAEIAAKGSPRSTFMAISALGRIGGEEARESLIDIASAGGAASGPALSALAQFPDGAEDAFDLAIDSVRRGGQQANFALEVLANDPRPEARNALLAAARRGEGPTAMQAVAQLGQRRDPESVRALAELAGAGRTADIRSTALAALAQSGDPAAAGALEGALKNARGQERVQAAMGLVELGGAGAERALLEATRDERDPEFLAGVSGALAQVGSPAALARLEQLAARGDAGSASSALQALAMSSPDRAAPLAESLSRSSDLSVRLGVLQTVGQLPDGAGQRIVLGALRDQDEQVVRQALESVQWIGVDPAAGRAALSELAASAGQPEDIRSRAQDLLNGFPSDGDRS